MDRYVWGGREVAAGRYDNPSMEEYGADLHVLDTKTNRWSVVTCRGDAAHKPDGRRSHSACMDQKLFDYWFVMNILVFWMSFAR